MGGVVVHEHRRQEVATGMRAEVGGQVAHHQRPRRILSGARPGRQPWDRLHVLRIEGAVRGKDVFAGHIVSKAEDEEVVAGCRREVGPKLDGAMKGDAGGHAQALGERHRPTGEVGFRQAGSQAERAAHRAFCTQEVADIALMDR